MLVPIVNDSVGADLDRWINYRQSYSGGGTSSNPYIIDSPEKLAMLAYETSQDNQVKTGYYKLTTSLDMGGKYFNPIGAKNTFKGTFDGGNNVILNLKVNIVGYAGLFDSIVNAAIKNLGLIDAEIICNYDGFSGGIAGYALNCRIQDCYVYGGTVNNIVGRRSGGIIGAAEGTTVTDCFVNNVRVKTTLKKVESKQITKSLYSSGQINSYSDTEVWFPGGVIYEKTTNFEYAYEIAGIIGLCYGATSSIINCYSNAIIDIGGPYTLKNKEIVEVNEQMVIRYTDVSMDWYDFLTAVSMGGIVLNETITESQYNTFVSGKTKKQENTNTNLYGKGLFFSNAIATNCYHTYSGDITNYVEPPMLKTYASRLGSKWSQNSMINGGFPYLKSFYWQDAV